MTGFRGDKRTTKTVQESLIENDLRRSGLDRFSHQRLGVIPLDADSRKDFALPDSAPGFLIPYYDTDGKTIRKDKNGDLYARVRLLGETATAGSKYRCKPKSGNRLYLPRAQLRFKSYTPSKAKAFYDQLFRDTSTPIYIVEGEKKAMAGMAAGLDCVGIAGCWGWSQDQEPIADLRRFDWTDREVILAMDGDWRSNPDILTAAERLADVLYFGGRAASVHMLVLPEETKGLDDFLVSLPADANSIEEVECLDRRLLPTWVARLNESYFTAPFGGDNHVWREEVLPTKAGAMREKRTPYKFEAAKRLYPTEHGFVRGAGGKPRPVPIMQAWFSHPAHRRYDGLQLWPGDDDVVTVEHEGVEYPVINRYKNTWDGFAVEPALEHRGLANKWIQLLHVACENEGEKASEIAEYLWKVLAWKAQNPGLKPELGIALTGPQGTGKTEFVKQYGELFGRHYVHVEDKTVMDDQFTESLDEAIIVFLDEADFAGNRKLAALLKGRITGDMKRSNRKFMGSEYIPSHEFFFVASNHPEPVLMETDDRRWLVLEFGDSKQENKEFFGALIAEMRDGGRAELLRELQEQPLNGWDPREHKVPMTGAKATVKRHALNQGRQPGNTVMEWFIPRFENGWSGLGLPAWNEEQPKKDLYRDYKAWVEHDRKNYHREAAVGPRRFFAELRAMFPAGQLKQSQPRQESGKRPRVLKFPPMPVVAQHLRDKFGLEVEPELDGESTARRRKFDKPTSDKG